jgi:phage protein D/phage baseplate assembly protein gpV
MSTQGPPQLEVSIDGTRLSPELEQNLLSVTVVDSLNIPDAFDLAFSDQFHNVLSEAKIEIGKAVEIKAADKVLLSGEVTALETAYEPGVGARTIVRGMDHSHRLFRGRRTRTFNNEPYSNIARTIAQEAGLEVGTIDATATPGPEQHVSQANVTDWQFVRWLAAQSNRVAAVREGKFEFSEPTEPDGAPPPGPYDTADPRLLAFGHNLLRFRTIVTSAEQVEQVEVRGWDVSRKDKLVATSPAETTSAALSVRPEELAAKFGSGLTLVATDTPYHEDTDLDTVAARTADEVAGTFAEFEGLCLGSADLKAGAAVRLQDIGEPFEGTYLITSSRHRWTPDTGYRTLFEVTGKQDRSLLGLTSPGTTVATPTPAGPRIPGVVSAIVTDVADDKKSCRVKLRFPWLSDDYESGWARTVQVGAGDKRGTLVVPEVNDEVLVAFEQGDIRHPFVLGGLYNGVDQPLTSEYVDGSSGAIIRREFVSRQGHVLKFDDKDGSTEGVTVATGDGRNTVHLDQTGKKIRISADAGGAVVEINSNGDMKITATGDVKIEGRAIEVSAQTRLQLKAQTISIQGNGPVEVTGRPIKLN